MRRSQQASTMTTPTPTAKRHLPLTLIALGVVFGDIGTSPLYAVREAFAKTHGLAVEPETVLGVLSLVIWSLFLIVSVKYAVIAMRADRNGEGGILILTSLVTPLRGRPVGARRAFVLLGLFGTALLVGDGMITPSITVLSAVEGLAIVAPRLEAFMLPIAIVILVVLFVAQRRGTDAVGKVFGPIMLTWFVVIAALGVASVVREPGVLAALDPRHAATFFAHERWKAFLVLGSVFLAVTGGEALYADIGHVGKRAARIGWFAVALPALLLNYAGQGALLLGSPDATGNPFFRLAPAWVLAPLVGLATLAAIIASQALISGVFSLTMQAVRLGYLPRLKVDHTSAKAFGQVYVGAVNWLLLCACVALVLAFGSSSDLAAAYGVAVTATMLITSILLAVVAREVWRWSVPAVAASMGLFLLIDTAFLGANLAKVLHGGWFPLVVGALVFTVMTTWRRGRQELRARLGSSELAIDRFLGSIRAAPPRRVPGTAVVMHGVKGVVPPVLLANLRYNHVLHQTVVMLAVETAEEPRVLRAERTTVKAYGDGFFQVVLRFGFMERANVPAALADLVHPYLNLDPDVTTYFLGRELVMPAERRRPLPPQAGRKTGSPLPLWRQRLFALLARNAVNAAYYYSLPSEHVIEVGVQVEL